MRKSIMIGLASLALAGAVMVPTVANAEAKPAKASDGGPIASWCARRFDQAQRVDMESFAAYDLPTWRAIHVPEATTVFASGRVAVGLDEIVRLLQGHFDGREATWTWTELHRVVDGCRTAFIVYDATYSLPSANFTQRTVVGVTYTFRGGRWLVVADQSTLLPPPPA